MDVACVREGGVWNFRSMEEFVHGMASFFPGSYVLLPCTGCNVGP
jgi:hypothetical protein